MMKPVLYGSLGPSCENADLLAAMLDAGMEGVRLNLSHGSLAVQAEALELLDRASAMVGITPRIMVDFRGRETRLGAFRGFAFEENQLITFSPETVPLPRETYNLLKQGDTFTVEDGRFSFEVLEAEEDSILAMAQDRGLLQPGKNVTLPKLGGSILCPEDLEDLRLAERWGIRELMLPFAQCREDCLYLERKWAALSTEPMKIFAKIESPEGVNRVQEIAQSAHAVVIARGDLGSRVPLPRLPKIQRELAEKCNALGKPFMVVTQMLQSMIQNNQPTRAEVNDIAQAVWSGAGYLMLTGETAAGRYPLEAMQILADTVRESLA